MRFFRPGQGIDEAYREDLQNPERMLVYGAIVNRLRTIADAFPHPVNYAPGDEFLFASDHVMERGKIFQKFLDTVAGSKIREIEPWMVTHYRIAVIISDGRFENDLRRETTDLGCIVGANRDEEHIQNVNGFIVHRRLLESQLGVPHIYLRESLMKDRSRLTQVLAHRDSHAFGMVLDPVEEAFGYWEHDGGNGERQVRTHVNELIANIEADEPFEELEDEPPVQEGQGPGADVQRMLSMRRENHNVIVAAREELPGDSTDLPALLRVIPVQVMGKVLPLTISAYKQAGELPEYKPVFEY